MLAPPALPTQVVSTTLADELKRKVREGGLLLWLDAEHQYNELVDALRGGAFEFKYPVIALRGSYLEVMLALEPYGNDLRPEHVLLHLPGLNKETIKETPLFELYKAGTSYEKNLSTLVKEAARGLAKPDEVETVLHTPGLSLGMADQWLESLRAQPRDGLALLLDTLGLDDVVLGLIANDRRFHEHLPAGAGKVLDFLEKRIGVSAAWQRARNITTLDRDGIARLLSSWLMAVEFVHDLREAPVTPELKALTKLGPYAKDCRRLAARLREQQPDTYETLEADLQPLMDQERTSHAAAALGSIDTFRFEEAATRYAALSALTNGDWDIAETYANERTTEHCFWVKRSVALQRTWELIRQAANAGKALNATQQQLDGANSLEEAVERYVDHLAPVDRRHREFEQRAYALLASDLEDYEALLRVRLSVRRAYRSWADGINRRFFELCVSRGVLPDPSLRQRNTYEQVVHPLVEQGCRVAFILVDALRFEMAQGFALDLKREKYQVSLGARLAELPTVTAIGMNALAPVAKNGRMRLLMTKKGDLGGFATGEFTVNDPLTRVRAMSQRSVSGIAESLRLEEFQELSLTQLKRRLLGKPPLVIVHSRDLDEAGEHNFHLGTFEQTLALLKSALSLLSQAGIERFVIASDHGFLLQDATVESVTLGTVKGALDRRHACLSQPSGKSDVLELPWSALEYDVDDEKYLVFRPDSAPWRVNEQIAPFVHGGNSLQERVIPVLSIERPGQRGKTIAKYEVVAFAEPAHLGRQRLRLAVRLQNQQTGALGFAAPKQISLALRVVPGRPDLTISLLNAGPPAELRDGRIQVPPNRDEAIVEFEIEGQFDEKVRVEVFHPDAAEDVTPKVVEGFFDAARNRRLGKASSGDSARPGTDSFSSGESNRAPTDVTSVAPESIRSTLDWEASIENEGYRKILKAIQERRSINEEEITIILGSSRQMRVFSRQYETLVTLVPFEIEICTVGGMKTYVRKD
ncbi:MAG TPA: BREX-6 system phosphatase PglZ [Polyangiaceae bacterium]